MKWLNFLTYKYVPDTPGKDWRALLVLMSGLLLTLVLAILTYSMLKQQEDEDFYAICKEIQLKVDSRLQAHVLILRAGAALFAVSDTVTRDEWREFFLRSQFSKTLPGIQGVGYAKIVPEWLLQQHIQQVREEGFPHYSLYPEGERETYTSILYIEPFSGRNLRAFGYDMFSNPVRRKAMEDARDGNMAMLSGKVDLVQETDEDVQAGTLMYVPVYRDNMPVNTVEQRTKAIKGWVYSPYRMDDLMRGILGRWDYDEKKRIHLEMYDDSISSSSLLYDSQKELAVQNYYTERRLILPVSFNGKQWILLFTQPRQLPLFNLTVLLIILSGTIISGLLFLLTLSFSKVSIRSEQIRRQNEELKKINATKDKFFSIIAHDLKSPFNAIVGFSDIMVKLVEQKNYDGVVKYSQIIHQSSLKAVSLLMNLMEWAQSQTGRISFNPEKFNLVDLILEVESLFADLAAHKSIHMVSNMPGEIMLEADRPMISTILRNLLSNAVKYTDNGGTITISAGIDDQHAKVSIADTGVGIAPENLGKLFRIDENYSTSGTANEKGTGLGLILLKEFVDKHQGTIQVESQPGVGSTFLLTIPLSQKAD